MDKKESASKFETVILRRSDLERGGVSVAGESKQERRPRRNRFRKEAGEDAVFIANVRFSEPILSVTALSKVSVWKKDLPYHIGIGLLLLSFISIFCMMIDEPVLIACGIPAVAVYTALAMLDSLDRSKIKYIACGVIMLLLIAAAVIFRSTIGPGLAYLTDEFYDVAEEAQAYIYDRFPGGDSASGSDTYIAVAWLAALLGTLMAAIPARSRRIVCMLLTAGVMLSLAYYGLVPSWICAGAMVLALLLTVSRDNILAPLPLMLAVVVIFGAITLIDPGEFYGISRADENIRDRVAFHSALLETGTTENPQIPDAQSLAEAEASEEASPVAVSNPAYVGIAVAVLIIAALGAAAFFLYQQYKKRRDAVRKGIDSKDPREAVTAMFPYSVRWLKAAGIESDSTEGEAPFSAMQENISRVYESSYASRFGEMYRLWREAAYSDHDISDDDRAAMDRFTKDTISLVSDKWKTAQKLRMKYRHAL